MPPEFQAWAESVSFWQILLWVGGVGGSLLLLKRFKVWSKLRALGNGIINFVDITEALGELPDFMKRTDAALEAVSGALERQDGQIDDIHHEVHYNNGSSVKDGVQRVEEGLAGLHVEVATIAQDLLRAKSALTISDAGIRQDLVDRRELEDHRKEDV